MATSPVTLDFTKAQPITLDFSKAELLNKKSEEPGWWEHLKAILAPRTVPRTDMGPQVNSLPGSFEGHPENVGEYIPASVGEMAGGIGGLVGGYVGAKFPLKSHAGKLFSEVGGAANQLPVDVAKPGNLALEAQELSKQGNAMPKVIRDFIARTTDPEKPPLTYAEARQFYSSTSRISANES